MIKLSLILKSIVIIIFLIILYFLCIRTHETFAGVKHSQEVLNKTLIDIVDILNKENIDDWFIGYGTLLGIVRENNCIDNDDDIDIVLHVKHKDKLIELAKKYNYSIMLDTPYFVKLYKQNKPVIDFYICTIDEKGRYNDSWENVLWTDPNPTTIKTWNNVSLKLPKDPERILLLRYGEDWKTPKTGYKGISLHADRKKNNIMQHL